MVAFATEHLVAIVSTLVAVSLALIFFCVCPRKSKEPREAGETLCQLVRWLVLNTSTHSPGNGGGNVAEGTVWTIEKERFGPTLFTTNL